MQDAVKIYSLKVRLQKERKPKAKGCAPDGYGPGLMVGAFDVGVD